MSAERLLIRRGKVSDYGADSQQRGVGLAVALAGLGAVAVAVAGTIAAGNLAGSVGGAEKVAGLAAWSFGLSSAAFATIKVGIAVILAGILVRLWTRVEAVKSSLPRLVGGQQAKPGPFGATSVDTPFGQATLSASTPGPLLIHRMARVMWAPSLAMGYMAVLAGLALSIIQSSRIGSDPELALRLSAWVPGVQFLGEGLVLGGIAFLLGSILASLRAGGGEVQEALGVPVKTLRMPLTAKLFVALMMAGVMVAMFQFVVYAVVSAFGDPSRAGAFFAWLGPLREAGLGFFLAGIVLALVTIGNVLGFQFSRIREIIRP